MRKTVATYAYDAAIGGAILALLSIYLLDTAHAQKTDTQAVLPVSSCQVPQEEQKPVASDKENTLDKTIDKTLSGFVGIVWGDRVEQASKLLKEKGAKLEKSSNPNTLLIVKDLKVAGYDTKEAHLYFGDEGFYQAIVFFDKNKAQDGAVFYNTLKQIVAQRFGQPVAEVTAAPDAPAAGQGKADKKIPKKSAIKTVIPKLAELIKTKLGKGKSKKEEEAPLKVYSVWDFPGPNEHTNLYLSLDIEMKASLLYQATDRMNREVARQREARAKDL